MDATPPRAPALASRQAPDWPGLRNGGGPVRSSRVASGVSSPPPPAPGSNWVTGPDAILEPSCKQAPVFLLDVTKEACGFGRSRLQARAAPAGSGTDWTHRCGCACVCGCVCAWVCFTPSSLVFPREFFQTTQDGGTLLLRNSVCR